MIVNYFLFSFVATLAINTGFNGLVGFGGKWKATLESLCKDNVEKSRNLDEIGDNHTTLRWLAKASNFKVGVVIVLLHFLLGWIILPVKGIRFIKAFIKKAFN